MSTTTVASSGFKAFMKYLKVSSLFLLFLIVFLNSIVKSVEQKSALPILEDLGNNLLLSTKSLTENSNEIIATGNVYDFSSWRNSLDSIVLLSEFLFAAFVCYTWIKVFGSIWNMTPFSFKGNVFAETFLGFMTFYVIQVISLLAYAGLSDQLTVRGDVAIILLTPIKAIFLFFKAIGVILFPVSSKVDKYLDLNKTIS